MVIITIPEELDTFAEDAWDGIAFSCVGTGFGATEYSMSDRTTCEIAKRRLVQYVSESIDYGKEGE
jgi:hypothetical protein